MTCRAAFYAALIAVLSSGCMGEVGGFDPEPPNPATLEPSDHPPVVPDGADAGEAADDAGAPNQAPTVSCGADVTVTLPTATVTLTATADDADGTISSTRWTELSGPPAALSGDETSTLTVSGLIEGTYVFRFTATDDLGATSSDDVTLTVLPEPSAPVTTQRELGTTAAPYGYVEYLPAGYSTDLAKTFPILIVLHGIGEEGNGTTQLGSVRVNGPNVEIDQKGKSFPMVILTPQSPGWWNANTLDTFVTYALATYRVDPKRVYLTGLSMGGGGTWDYAAAHGDRLAAIVPICGASGGGNDTTGKSLVDHGVAVWAAHATNDGTVPVSETNGWMTGIGHALGGAQGDSLFTAYPQGTTDWQTAHFDTTTNAWVWTVGQDYRDANGTPWSPKQFVTIYPDGNHFIWGRMYSDQKVYDWLLQQARP